MDDEIATAILHNISFSNMDTGIEMEGGKVIADNLSFRRTRRPIVVRGGRGHQISNVRVDY